MHIDMSSPARVALLITQQEGWTLEELTDLLDAYRQHNFAENSKWFLKFNYRMFKRRKDLNHRWEWKDFTKALDEFNDTNSTLKLQAQHA